MLRSITIVCVLTLVTLFSTAADIKAETGIRRVDELDLDIWINKGNGSTYYYGEDVAIFFKTSQDCYVVIYDIDPAGNVSLLFPSDYNSECFVRGGEVYRIPDAYDDYRLEVTGPKGKEYIYGVASFNRIDTPDFIRYEYYEYDNWDYYYDDFVHSTKGDRAAFVADLNARIVNGPYMTASTMFYIDDNYRHHRWYRHWTYDPYNIGSVWIGCDFVGAEVWIDGCYYGIAPILVPEIYIGRHWIWIYYHGYPCWQNYVHIRYGQRYYVDAKINRHFRDYDYGRSKLRRWVFKEDKHRNDQKFIREAERVRNKHIRPLPKPPRNIQEKYSKRVVSEKRFTNGKDVRYKTVDKVKTDNQRNTGSFRGDGILKKPVSQKKVGKPLNRDDKSVILDTKEKRHNTEQKDISKSSKKSKSGVKSKEKIKSKPVKQNKSVDKKEKSSKSGKKVSPGRSRR